MGAGLKSERLPIAGLIRAAAQVSLFCFALASSGGSGQSNFVARAEKAFQTAQTAWATNTTNFSIALSMARAAFDLAEFPRSNKERERLAQTGIEAAQAALSAETNSAAAHYYLGLNLGQLARTRTIGALKLVAEMERTLKRAIELDPDYENAGAIRTLSVVYVEAPGWPMSVGSKSRARALMKRGLELAPRYPAAHLNYIEALQKWGELKEAAERIAAYKTLLPDARREFSGEDWEDEWASWDARWESILAKQK